MIRAELDAAAVRRSPAARRLRAVPAAQRAARPDVLPGDEAAAAGAAPRGARAVRARPVGRRHRGQSAAGHRRRPGRGAPRRGGRRPVRRAARRAQRGPAAGGGGGHRGAVPDRADAVRRLLRLDADGPRPCATTADRAALDGVRARVGRGHRAAGAARCSARSCPRPTAAPYAAALGKAFQLTNFLRDVAEDLDRGRVYLPADELAAFGVDRALLEWCRARRATDPRVRAALADQHARTREVYAFARPGIALLAAGVAALRGHGAHAVLADPGRDRGLGVRGLRPPRPGGTAAAGRGGRAGPRAGPVGAAARPGRSRRQ